MRHHASTALPFLFSSLPVVAQAGPQDPTNFLPRYSLALGYNNIRANAPPANCGCFNMDGGSASGSYAFNYWLNAAAEATGGHAKDIGSLGQNLTLTTYTAGPQVTFRGRASHPTCRHSSVQPMEAIPTSRRATHIAPVRLASQ